MNARLVILNFASTSSTCSVGWDNTPSLCNYPRAVSLLLQRKRQCWNMAFTRFQGGKVIVMPKLSEQCMFVAPWPQVGSFAAWHALIIVTDCWQPHSYVKTWSSRYPKPDQNATLGVFVAGSDVVLIKFALHGRPSLGTFTAEGAAAKPHARQSASHSVSASF